MISIQDEFCKRPMPATAPECPHCFREPLEKSEQVEVVRHYLSYGCRGYNLSQARASKQTPGLPDLWLRVAITHGGTGVSGRSLDVHHPRGVCTSQSASRPASDTPIGGVNAAWRQLVTVGAARWREGHDGG